MENEFFQKKKNLFDKDGDGMHNVILWISTGMQVQNCFIKTGGRVINIFISGQYHKL